jgi:hypothetical protein
MEKIDPHDRQRLFEDWKNRPIEDLSSANAKILKEYILDLEKGLNVGGSKGTRSAGRLLAKPSSLKRVKNYIHIYSK